MERTPSGLHAEYRIEGDLDRVRIPASTAPRRMDGLWRHTCCELFVSRGDEPAYREFNFSPSGEWAAYAFKGYRDPAPLPDLLPGLRVQRAQGCLELHARVPITEGGKFRIAVSTVIEDSEGALSYWALAHPPGKPDFHHRDAFVAELA